MSDLKRILAATCLVGALALPAPVYAGTAGQPSISRAIDWAVEIAHDQDYGYSQDGRWGSKGYDCSSFVISAFWHGGFDLGYDSRKDGDTEDIKYAFLNAGFEWIPAEDLQLENGSCDMLEAGDVLLMQGYHAEMYIGDGLTAAAHEDIPSPEHPNRSPDFGNQGDEICVYEYVWHPWTGVLRYKGHSSGTSKKSSESASHASEKGDVYEVLVDSLLVREEPKSGGTVLELLEENEQITVTSINDGWGRTTVRGKDGYVNMSYVRKVSTKSGSSESADTGKGTYKDNSVLTVNASKLYMREDHSTESSVICMLHKDDKVTLMSRSGDWGYMSFEGMEGWVNLKYCV